MVGAKWFCFETPGFQNATTSLLCTVCLVVGLGISSACSRSSPATPPYNAGLIAVETPGHASDDLQAIAEALLQHMRHDRLRVGFYSPGHAESWAPVVATLPRTDSAAGTKRLKEAWAAYYEMRLGEAEQLAELETAHYAVTSADGLRARLLSALISIARQDRTRARKTLRELPPAWPTLTLSETQYPPHFVTLYGQIERASRNKAPQPLVLAAHRPLTALRRPIRAVAESRRWKQVWLLRVSSQGGKKRAELQQVSDGGRRFTHYRSVRFGPAARPEKVAGMLWEGRAAI